MRAQQVNKLYSKLTPQKQAVLAFEAAIRLDEHEVDLILDSVEIQTYSMPHIDYCHRVQGLTNLSSAYGLAYWKTLCQLGVLVALSLDDNDKYDKTAQRLTNKLFSMDVALDEVCKELKIDVSTIKKFAECSDYKPNLSGEPEEQLIEQYKEIFTAAVYLN